MLIAIGIGVVALCICLASMLCMGNYKKKMHIKNEAEMQSDIKRHKSDNQEIQKENQEL